jgi:hypothetical protein
VVVVVVHSSIFWQWIKAGKGGGLSKTGATIMYCAAGSSSGSRGAPGSPSLPSSPSTAVAITNPASLIEVEMVDGLSLSGDPIRFGEMHGPPLLSVHPKSATLLLKDTPATVETMRNIIFIDSCYGKMGTDSSKEWGYILLNPCNNWLEVDRN